MDQKKIGRLNQLFEKMVSNAVSSSEKNELSKLYSHYIDEGRLSSDKSTHSSERRTL